MGVRRNFSRGGVTSTFCLSFSACWRCKWTFTKRFAPFYTLKKGPHVTTTVTKMRSLAVARHGSGKGISREGPTRAVSAALHTPIVGHAVTRVRDSDPSPRRVFCGLRPPDKASTHQIEIWNTGNLWSFYQSVFYSVIIDRAVPAAVTENNIAWSLMIRLWGNTRIWCLSVKRQHIHCLNCWSRRKPTCPVVYVQKLDFHLIKTYFV